MIDPISAAVNEELAEDGISMQKFPGAPAGQPPTPPATVNTPVMIVCVFPAALYGDDLTFRTTGELGLTPPTRSVGHALKADVTDCATPLIVSVAEQDCGPVPAGGTTPGEIVTLKSHCVLAGVTSALSCRDWLKLPVESRVNGPVVPWNGTWHGEEPKPLDRHACTPVTVTVGWPFTAAPARTSCAFIDAPEYGTPFGSFTVPVTMVVCAKQLDAKKKKEAVRKNLRMRSYPLLFGPFGFSVARESSDRLTVEV